MHTAYLVVTWIAIAMTTFSSIATIAHNKRIIATLDAVNVPRSWLVFPIATLKLSGAIGLFLGLTAIHGIGTAAAFGLVLYFTCAVYTHLFAGDFSLRISGAVTFLLLSGATLWLNIADLHPTWD
ncbi:DoxX family protein [Nocardia sp. NPDC004711]